MRSIDGKGEVVVAAGAHLTRLAPLTTLSALKGGEGFEAFDQYVQSSLV